MKLLIFVALLLFSNPLWAKLRVVTTTPDLSWLVENIGGKSVTVESLLDGSEDPHYVDAMPSWIAKVSRADVFCLVGLELEIGWVPKVLERSGNKKVQTGGKGYCETGKFISALEVPKGKIDRSMGDIHPSGNPHYHLGPEQFKNAAKGIFEVLVTNDPDARLTYSKNLAQTLQQIDKTKEIVVSMIKDLKEFKLMSYHKEFSYFMKDFDLQYSGIIEEIPGVPPSAGRIARIALEAKKNNVDVVLASTANPKKLLEKFKEISGVQYKQVPISIRKLGNPSNYEELLVGIAKAIVESKK